MLEVKPVLSSQCPRACNLKSHKSSSTPDTGTWLLQVLAWPGSPCCRGCLRNSQPPGHSHKASIESWEALAGTRQRNGASPALSLTC